MVNFLRILIALFVLAGWSSCTMERRLYRDGIYMRLSHDRSAADLSLSNNETAGNLVQFPLAEQFLALETGSEGEAGFDTCGTDSAACLVLYHVSINDTAEKVHAEFTTIDQFASTKPGKDRIFDLRDMSKAWLIVAGISAGLLILSMLTVSGPLFLIGFLLAGLVECGLLYVTRELIRLTSKYPELKESKESGNGGFSSPYSKDGTADSVDNDPHRKARRQVIGYSWLSLLIVVFAAMFASILMFV